MVSSLFMANRARNAEAAGSESPSKPPCSLDPSWNDAACWESQAHVQNALMGFELKWCPEGLSKGLEVNSELGMESQDVLSWKGPSRIPECSSGPAQPPQEPPWDLCPEKPAPQEAWGGAAFSLWARKAEAQQVLPLLLEVLENQPWFLQLGIFSWDPGAALKLFWKSLTNRLLSLISFTQDFGLGFFSLNRIIFERLKC